MPTNLKIVHELITPCSLNTVKLLTVSSMEAQSEVMACCVTSLLGKEIKILFLFPPKLLSPYFFLALAQRAKILAALSQLRHQTVRWIGMMIR